MLFAHCLCRSVTLHMAGHGGGWAWLWLLMNNNIECQEGLDLHLEFATKYVVLFYYSFVLMKILITTCIFSHAFSISYEIQHGSHRTTTSNAKCFEDLFAHISYENNHKNLHFSHAFRFHMKYMPIGWLGYTVSPSPFLI